MHLGFAAQPSVDPWQRRAVRTRSPTECRSLLMLLRALLLPLGVPGPRHARLKVQHAADQYCRRVQTLVRLRHRPKPARCGRRALLSALRVRRTASGTNAAQAVLDNTEQYAR